MTTMIYSGEEGARVLFFGRSKCEASRRIVRELSRYGFDVTYVKSKRRGEKISEDIMKWSGDYIFCFRSFFVLPDVMIKKAKIAAINFHPGPPEYSGSGCINFALYDEVDSYGVTAHLMNEKVDNGKILEVRRFPVHKSDDLPGVLERTHIELYQLCSDFIKTLASVGEPYVGTKANECKELKWKGKARLMRELEDLKSVDASMNKSELNRIVRATYIEGFPPKVVLHGYNFYLKK